MLPIMTGNVEKKGGYCLPRGMGWPQPNPQPPGPKHDSVLAHPPEYPLAAHKVSHLVLLGAGSEAGPLAWLAQWRANIVAIDLARSAQVSFKIQIQEWKNLLLRSHQPEAHEKYRKAFEKEGGVVAERLSALEGLYAQMGLDTAPVKSSRDALKALQQTYLAALQSFDLADPAGSALVVDKLVKGKDREPTTQLDKLVSAVFELSQQRQQDEQARSRAATEQLVWSIALLLVLGLAVGVVTSWMILRSITRPLNDVLQAAADVAQAKATLARRKLDLQFASVEAPIAGRIDQTLVSEGALVSPTDATPMARIQQIDQVYVDLRLPAAVLDTLYQHSALSQAPMPVEILSSSGTPLGMQGQILFSGINVDTGTGDVLLRVLVDNPEHRLLPGLYVKARLTLAHYKQALYVPEQAVSRVAGQPMVWLLDGQNAVQPVSVVLAELIDGHYRVVSGLRAGQQLVVAGSERLSPSQQVVARPWPAGSEGAALSADAE